MSRDETLHLDIEAACANSQATIEKMNYWETKNKPSYIWKPKLSLDGNQWCALYGDDLQNGVAGFGDTPEKAMADFDKAWRQSITRSVPTETSENAS